MKQQDPYIIVAMDGKEGRISDIDAPSQRDGPAAFFFVIFGLIYETLAESSTKSSTLSSTNTATLACLEVLESLVRPEYAGNAITEAIIFDELTTLCYRMAMMETAEVHIPLSRSIASLASTQLIANSGHVSSTSFCQASYSLIGRPNLASSPPIFRELTV